MPETPASPDRLLELAEAIAREAASLVIARRATASPFGADTKTSATDLVTDADRAVEGLIVERILAERPDDGVDGEEGEGRPGRTRVVWHVDPIDGTTNFVYGLAGYAVSIGVSVRGEPVAGVVADPRAGEVFAATAGGGATCNGETITCTKATELATSLIATGFSYLPERRRRQALVLAEVLPVVRDIRRVGAASTDLCAVACGRVDGFYERGLNRWDHAAGALIAAEAGAVVGDLNGGRPSGEFVLAAAPGIFDALRDLLLQAGAERA